MEGVTVEVNTVGSSLNIENINLEKEEELVQLTFPEIPQSLLNKTLERRLAK